MVHGRFSLFTFAMVGALAAGCGAWSLGACSTFSADAPPADADGGGDTSAAGDAPANGGDDGGDGGNGGDSGKTSAYRAAVMADGPLAYWRMGAKNGLVITDETGNGNDLFLQGLPGSSGLGAEGGIAGDDDTAIRFDGISGYARAKDPRAFDFAGKAPFTVELWAKRDVIVNPSYFQQMVGESQGSAGNRTGYTLYVLPDPAVGTNANTAFEYNAYDGGETGGRGPVTPAGQWSHYAAVFDGVAITLYVDASAGTAKPVAGPSTLTTAQLLVGAADGSNFFPGTIDEVAIYAKALTLEQIANHRSAGRP